MSETNHTTATPIDTAPPRSTASPPNVENPKPPPSRRLWFAAGAFTIAALWAAREGMALAHDDPFDRSTFHETEIVLLESSSGNPASAATVIEVQTSSPVSPDDIARETEARIEEEGGISNTHIPAGYNPVSALCGWPSDTEKSTVTSLVLECSFQFQPETADDPGN